MADTKVSALTGATPVVTDLVYFVDDPAGTPVSAQCALSALDTLFSATTKTLTNKTLTSPTLTSPTINTGFTFDGVTFTAATGADTNIVSGTAGTSGDLAQ